MGAAMAFVESIVSKVNDPNVCLIAHNGFAFDFPMLITALRRNNVHLPSFLKFAMDTLHLLKSNKYKLQQLVCIVYLNFHLYNTHSFFVSCRNT